MVAYLGKRNDEIMRICFFARSLYKRLLPAIFDVLPFSPDQTQFDVSKDGVIEEEWLLLDDANLRAPPLEVDLSDVGVPNLNCASTCIGSNIGLLFFTFVILNRFCLFLLAFIIGTLLERCAHLPHRVNSWLRRR